MPHGEANLRRRGIMPIKDILVHVDESLACDNRLRVAADLAVRFDARLNGVGLAETVADKRFHVHLRRSGLAGEWHTGIGLPESFVTRRARVADLVVLGQPDPGRPATSDMLESPAEVVFACGRPVLVVPYAMRFERDGQPVRVGETVLIGWNGSREAVRAVHDGHELMTSDATVLSINPENGAERETSDLVGHLARREISVREEILSAEDLSTSETLLSRAADIGADLIVMGAYGHTRLRETILGGVTRDVLRHMTVPVLMAH
jgi:nucleotide-binding universal stress UspA family protein